jgi:hypothetical protein
VYTVNCERKQIKQKSTNKKVLFNELVLDFIKSTQNKYISVDINKLEDIEKVCIALINIRNRGR